MIEFFNNFICVRWKLKLLEVVVEVGYEGYVFVRRYNLFLYLVLFWISGYYLYSKDNLKKKRI